VESLEGAVPPINTFYVVGWGEVGRDPPPQFDRELFRALEGLHISRSMLRRAIRSFEDIEDVGIGEAAEAAGVDIYLYRTQPNFEPTDVPTLSPRAVIQPIRS
jgi:hypothetical protein